MQIYNSKHMALHTYISCVTWLYLLIYEHHTSYHCHGSIVKYNVVNEQLVQIVLSVFALTWPCIWFYEHTIHAWLLFCCMHMLYAFKMWLAIACTLYVYQTPICRVERNTLHMHVQKQFEHFIYAYDYQLFCLLFAGF